MAERQSSGRVALVTGAAGGLGLSFVERLARDGHDIVVTDVVDCGKALETAEAAGARAIAIPCDLTDPVAIDRLAKEAIGHFGHVDILLNNAAYLGGSGVLDQVSGEQLRTTLVVNVEAPFHLAKALVPNMRERGWGRIVSIVTGSAWLPPPGLLVYMTSKMGLVGLTRGLAATVAADGVTVNCIAPALTRTPPTEHLPQAFWDMSIATQLIRRPGMPDDLTGILSFVCSEESRFMTGQTLHVDGGAVL